MNDTNTARPTPRLARLRVSDYALSQETVQSLMTPALVVYEEKVKANLNRMLAYMGGEPGRWRAHLKTTKIPEVYEMLVDAGLRAFKCATAREAACMLEVLARRAIDGADLLIAYPLQGPSMVRAAQLAKQFGATPLSVLSEDPEHARNVPEALSIFIDVNPGMHRTGIPVQQAGRILGVAQAAGHRLRGIHFYDGHIHDEGAPARRSAAHGVYTQLIQLVEHLEQAGVEVKEVITSGTPTFRYALDFAQFKGGRVGQRSTVHRVSPGTVVFHDFQYDELLEDLELDPAALVLARVVSHPRDGVITCDAGSKSIAAECGNPVGFAIGHPQMLGLSPSEEHLPFDVGNMGSNTPSLGSLLHLVPRHICPTVNLAEKALLVRANGRTEVVEVAGRAHELLL